MKHIIVFVFLILTSVTGFSQSIVLDLKTHLAEKAQLSPSKIGASYWLLKDGYTLLDVGEDYSVWLTDYNAVTTGESIAVSVTVKIEPTTALTEKTPLASERVHYTLSKSAPRVTDTDEPATKFLREKLERKTDQAIQEGRVGGKAVADAIGSLLGKLGR